jgi:hypothetical protein
MFQTPENSVDSTFIFSAFQPKSMKTYKEIAAMFVVKNAFAELEEQIPVRINLENAAKDVKFLPKMTAFYRIGDLEKDNLSLSFASFNAFFSRSDVLLY